MSSTVPQNSRQQFLYGFGMALFILSCFIGAAEKESPTDSLHKSDTKPLQVPAVQYKPDVESNVSETSTEPSRTNQASEVILKSKVGLAQPSSKAAPLLQDLKPTHKQSGYIKAIVQGKEVQIETFCLDPQGNLIAACNSSGVGPLTRYRLNDPSAANSPSLLNFVLKLAGFHPVAGTSKQKILGKENLFATRKGKVVVISAEGKTLKVVEVPFVPTAINFEPTYTTLFVAGSGQVAKLDLQQGKVIQSGLAPHIQDLDSFKVKMIQSYEEERKEHEEYYKQETKRLTDRLAKLEKIPEAKQTRLQKSQCESAKMMLKQLDIEKSYLIPEELNDDLIQNLLERKAGINTLTVTRNHLYLCCASAKGYGYQVWKTNHDFQNGEVVIKRLSGCCGRMDLQTDGENVIAAPKHRPSKWESTI